MFVSVNQEKIEYNTSTAHEKTHMARIWPNYSAGPVVIQTLSQANERTDPLKLYTYIHIYKHTHRGVAEGRKSIIVIWLHSFIYS